MIPQAHNLAALVVGTPEFSFAEGAISIANAQTLGFRDVGNLNSIQIQNEEEVLEHLGSYRGKRKVDKKFNTRLKFAYLLRADEMSIENLLFLYFGEEGTAFTQSALTAQAADTLNFTAAPTGWGAAKLGRWYDILVAGKRVRNITSVADVEKGTGSPTALIEGTDYILDKVQGRIRFLTATADVVNLDVNAPAITSASDFYLRAIKIGEKPSREGFGRLTVFDQNSKSSVVLEHTDFRCRVSINNQPEVDGENVTGVELMVEVLDPAGDLYIRN